MWAGLGAGGSWGEEGWAGSLGVGDRGRGREFPALPSLASGSNRLSPPPPSRSQWQIVRALEHLHSKLSVIHRGRCPGPTAGGRGGGPRQAPHARSPPCLGQAGGPHSQEEQRGDGLPHAAWAAEWAQCPGRCLRLQAIFCGLSAQSKAGAAELSCFDASSCVRCAEGWVPASSQPLLLSGAPSPHTPRRHSSDLATVVGLLVLRLVLSPRLLRLTPAMCVVCPLQAEWPAGPRGVS